MLLEGKTGLIIGVANRHSIAAGCAEVMAGAGARLALTYLNEKARPHAEPIGEAVGAEAMIALDVRDDGAIETAFEQIKKLWGRLDFLVHSIAFCPKDDLHTDIVNCSRDGFAEAMDISCYSFIRTARAALPLMTEGGAITTVSYYGAEKVVDNYNIMGPVKAALESSVRYLADGLGPRNVRVNAVSPGPIATRAASGIEHFDHLLAEAAMRAPAQKLSSIQDVGEMVSFLSSDRAKAVTGGVHYVDCGLNIVA